MEIKEILKSNDYSKKKALFSFSNEQEKIVLLKFNLWARHCFGKYFTSNDAPFHNDIDKNNLRAYRGEIKSFTDIAFRDGAKTARTKLFVAFCIANDLNHFRRYFKVLAEDGTNSKQIVTDVYNMLIQSEVRKISPEIFRKTNTKREETMSSFTTATGIKLIADTVGVDQRGALQEEARPDFIWFEDFENRKSLRSAVKTIAIWDNMEEARTGLSKDGACIYTCNYISEAGNVHKLVNKEDDRNIVLITPIIKDGVVAWDRYTVDDVERMKKEDDDFEGERLCEPSAGKDIYFDRQTLDKMDARQPIKVSAEFKIFYKFNPSHRYGSGHDVAGGVGLDSSASVFIDFSTVPARVVGTFANNLIKPETFGDEVFREQEIFGGCISAVENNYGTEAILKLKQLDANLYTWKKKDTEIRDKVETEYGWNTNQLTKPKMMSALLKALEDGLLELCDKGLIAEAKSYTRNDLLEFVRDPRLTTRHFDLLIACAIAWQMKDFAKVMKKIVYKQPEVMMTSEFYGGGAEKDDDFINKVFNECK